VTRLPRWLVALVAAGLLLACGGDPSAVAWRDLDLTLPDGWVVVQDFEGVLYVGDGEMADEGDAGDLTVGIQFLEEDTPSIQDWRDLVADRDGTVELDRDGVIDGLPTSELQFTLPGDDGDVPATRERVITVPSRHLVILAQAVPLRGQQDGAQLFLDGLDDIEALLESVDFGAPEQE
jgi:hypothetical protein